MLNSFCLACYLLTDVPAINPQELARDDGLQGYADLPAWLETSVDIREWQKYSMYNSAAKVSHSGTESADWVTTMNDVSSPTASLSPPASTIFSSACPTLASGSSLTTLNSNNPHLMISDNVSDKESCEYTISNPLSIKRDEQLLALLSDLYSNVSEPQSGPSSQIRVLLREEHAKSHELHGLVDEDMGPWEKEYVEQERSILRLKNKAEHLGNLSFALAEQKISLTDDNSRSIVLSPVSIIQGYNLTATEDSCSPKVADILIPSVEISSPRHIQMALEIQTMDSSRFEEIRNSSPATQSRRPLLSKELNSLSISPEATEASNTEQEISEESSFNLKVWNEECQVSKKPELENTRRSILKLPTGNEIFHSRESSSPLTQDFSRHSKEVVSTSKKDQEAQLEDTTIGDNGDGTISQSSIPYSGGRDSQGLSPDSLANNISQTEAFLSHMIKECGEIFTFTPGSLFTSHGSTSSPSRSTETASSFSTSPNLSRKSIHTRKRSAEEDEEDEKKRPNRGFKQPRLGPGEGPYPYPDPGRRLACHLHIADPQKFSKNSRTGKKYDTCSGPGWYDVHHLKQHLGHSASAVHKKFRCPLCHQIFKSSKAIMNHIRESPDCRKEPSAVDSDDINDTAWDQIDGKITRSGFEQLPQHTRENIDNWVNTNLIAYAPSKPMETRKDELRKWHMIWSILFPSKPVPTHPFYDSDSFLPQTHAGILKGAYKEKVEARIALGILPESFQEFLGVLEDCLQEAIEYVSRPGAVAVEAPSILGSPFHNQETILSPFPTRPIEASSTLAQPSVEVPLSAHPFSGAIAGYSASSHWSQDASTTSVTTNEISISPHTLIDHNTTRSSESGTFLNNFQSSGTVDVCTFEHRNPHITETLHGSSARVANHEIQSDSQVLRGTEASLNIDENEGFVPFEDFSLDMDQDWGTCENLDWDN